jgi:hypothetical protein
VPSLHERGRFYYDVRLVLRENYYYVDWDYVDWGELLLCRLGENGYDVDWIHEKTLFVNLLVGDQYKFEFSDFVSLRS